MKFLKIALPLLIVFFVGYALGNFIPWSGFGNNGGTGILGSAKLEVTILDPNNMPVQNIEVDVAEQPGPPPRGGVASTDQNGIASFSVQPGNYFIYFNSSNFPQNLKEGEPQAVQVAGGIYNKTTIILKNK